MSSTKNRVVHPPTLLWRNRVLTRIGAHGVWSVQAEGYQLHVLKDRHGFRAMLQGNPEGVEVSLKTDKALESHEKALDLVVDMLREHGSLYKSSIDFTVGKLIGV